LAEVLVGRRKGKKMEEEVREVEREKTKKK
jgi:hypothetical protein